MGIVTPLNATGLITMSMGMVFFKPAGSVIWEELGIVEPLTIQCEFEELEIFDPRSGTRVLAQSDVTQTTVTVNATLKMMTARNRALSMAGDVAYENQAPVTGGTFTVEDVAAGGIYEVGKLNLSNLVATDEGGSGAVPYVLDTHYKVDTEAGLVQILALPDDSDLGDDFILTYDAAGILPPQKRLRVGIGSQPNLRGGLIFRGTNQIGVRSLIRLHDVQFRPSGERSLVTEEYTQLEITGRAFNDTTQPVAEQYGYEATLT